MARGTELGMHEACQSMYKSSKSAAWYCVVTAYQASTEGERRFRVCQSVSLNDPKSVKMILYCDVWCLVSKQAFSLAHLAPPPYDVGATGIEPHLQGPKLGLESNPTFFSLFSPVNPYALNRSAILYLP